MLVTSALNQKWTLRPPFATISTMLLLRGGEENSERIKVQPLEKLGDRCAWCVVRGA